MNEWMDEWICDIWFQHFIIEFRIGNSAEEQYCCMEGLGSPITETCNDAVAS